MQITFAQVAAGTVAKGDYVDGTVTASTDNTVTIKWDGSRCCDNCQAESGGSQVYTWEEVREYGFTFYSN